MAKTATPRRIRCRRRIQCKVQTPPRCPAEKPKDWGAVIAHQSFAIRNLRTSRPLRLLAKLARYQTQPQQTAADQHHRHRLGSSAVLGVVEFENYTGGSIGDRPGRDSVADGNREASAPRQSGCGCTPSGQIL